jgi:hypothetical protein
MVGRPTQQKGSTGTNGTTVDDPNIDDQNNDDEEEEKTPEAEVIFPTHPGFTVPVEIKPTPHLGPDQLPKSALDLSRFIFIPLISFLRFPISVSSLAFVL